MKSTSKVLQRSFISAAAFLFAVNPLAAQALDKVPTENAVWKVTTDQCTTKNDNSVSCTYSVYVSDDPDLSHLNIEVPDGAVAVASGTSTGSDGSLKGTDDYLKHDDDPMIYVKWDDGQKVDTVKEYTVTFQNVPEDVDDNWTCRMVLKGARIYTVADVRGPCHPGDDPAEPTLHVNISDTVVTSLNQGYSQGATDVLENNSVDLIAGQHIDVGSVSVELENLYGNIEDPVDTLVVTYETDDGWYLDETHLWVKTNDQPTIPANKKGNPKIGNFPYISEYISDTTSTVEIPLDTFGNLQEALCNSLISYRLNADLAAHASVLHDSFGQETAWAAGDEIITGRSWATKFLIQFSCD
ncbi:MAG: hypothetical protein D3924_00995 [Candidatus Electrothrix sp. AR4]|nr:hypothetical protein [Candidatus Electrothrix sp. AR4]